MVLNGFPCLAILTLNLLPKLALKTNVLSNTSKNGNIALKMVKLGRKKKGKQLQEIKKLREALGHSNNEQSHLFNEKREPENLIEQPSNAPVQLDQTATDQTAPEQMSKNIDGEAE